MNPKIVCRSLLAFGPLLVTSLYATWLIARLSLGYWPRPSLDDPKDIAWSTLPFFVTGALMLLWPAVLITAIAAAVLAWRAKDPERKKRVIETALGGALLLGAILFLRADPFHVGLWFMD